VGLDAIAVLKSIQSDQFETEEDFKEILVDDIFVSLFETSNFRLKGELNQKHSSSKISAMYKLDYAVVLKHHVCSSRIGQELYESLTKIPLIIIECSRDPLLPQFAHKDSSKIANSMAIALMDLIRCFSHQSIDFLSQLFVQGILLGGFDLEFLVMKPQFSSQSRDSDSEVKVSFLLSSSREFTRFSCFSNEVYNPDLEESSKFCSFTHGYLYVQPQCEETSLEYPSVDYSNDCWTNLVSEIDNSDGALNNFNEISGTGPISSTRSFYLNQKNWNEIPMKKSIVDEMIAHQLGRMNRSVNVNTLFVLTRIRSMADQLEGLLMQGLEDSDDPEIPDQPFDQNENVLRCYNSSRSRSDSFKPTPPPKGKGRPKKCAKFVNTPEKSSAKFVNTPAGEVNDENLDIQEHENFGNSTTRIRSYYKTIREPGATWISVTKQDSPFELEVYLHPLIRSSRHVPRLHPTILPERSINHQLTLTIERIYPLRRFGHNRSDSYILHGYSRLLIDSLEALTLLHSVGFVHSEISPNNVGYNERLGIWQIFDFDQAMPIEESLHKSRKGGTEHFISNQARETEIFRPIDDFIALTNCIFRSEMPTVFGDFHKFLPLLNEISNSSKVQSDWLFKARQLSTNKQ
jgi:hypothetical protein